MSGLPVFLHFYLEVASYIQLNKVHCKTGPMQW